MTAEPEVTREEATVAPDTAFRTRLPIRFSDCDAQGIVFNANYLRFCDNAVEEWFDSIPELADEGIWDFVVKRAEVEWSSSGRPGDKLDLALWVSRWGTTSFSTSFEGTIAGRPVFTTTLVYVTIDRETGRPVPVPDTFTTALG